MATTSIWNSLVDSLREVQVSMQRGIFDDAAWRFVKCLCVIVSDRQSYHTLLQHRGEQAQTLIDSLQWVLQTHPLSESGEKANCKILKATLRLSKAARLLPTTYQLPAVEGLSRLIEAPCADIYRGILHGRVVCLKKYRCCYLNPEAIYDLMSREAIIWANHRHPGILPFLGVYHNAESSFDSGLYLVSPFMEHGTIVQFLLKCPAVERRLLLKDIFEAVSYLHDHHIIHGDLKGPNVLVNSSGRACLADLGFSRLTDAAVLTWTSIQSNASLGTVPWQAPELLEVQRNGGLFVPTPATDIYALGCLTYEIFTGKAPFWDVRENSHSATRAYQIIKTVVKHKAIPTKPLPNSEPFRQFRLTEDIWITMENCWNQDPGRRPSASQLSTMAFLSNIEDRRPSFPLGQSANYSRSPLSLL